MLFNNSIKTSEKFSTHKQLVNYVKNLLHEDIFFMIAGGSLIDINRLNDINDIDVFFLCEDDFNRFNDGFVGSNIIKSHVSDNAITYKVNDENVIQTIQKYFGTPEEILDTFDLNQSKVLIDSNFVYYNNTNTSTNDLRIIYKNYRKDTPSRYIKYLKKGFSISTYEFNILLHYMIENKDTMYKSVYDKTETEIPGINIIGTFIHRLLEYKNENDIMFYIFDELNKSLNQDEMLQVYGTFFNNRHDIQYMYKYSLFIIAIRDEIVSKGYHFGEMANIPTPERMLEVQREYPEYFI